MARHPAKRILTARALALAAALALVPAIRPAQARVDVSIGINLPAPPALVAVPGTPVLYAPTLPANYFFYANQYWAFTDGVWYASSAYNGPWVVVAAEFVPRPILGVPVRYYRAPPRAWHAWRREAPPRWEARWGRRWAEPSRRAAVREHRRDDRRGDRR